MDLEHRQQVILLGRAASLESEVLMEMRRVDSDFAQWQQVLTAGWADLALEHE